MTDSRISRLAFIGDKVSLGVNVAIGPGAVLLGPCVIEDNVFIGAGSQIGAPPEMANLPQNAAWSGDIAHAGVIIEQHAIIREGAVIHQGSYRPTSIGQGSWVLNRAYVAHDVLLGAHSTLSAGVSIGGHCEIGMNVTIGMNAAVHQRTFVSAGAMIGMNTPVTRDVPPFAKVFGSPARIFDVNTVAMQRLGISQNEIFELRNSYQEDDLLLQKNDNHWQGFLAQAVKEWQNRENRNPTKAIL
jgi:UDP-N-acetylglucosamine acyltransferase